MSGGTQAWLVPSCYGVAWKSSRSVLTVGSGDIDGGGFEQGQWRSRRVERKRERGEVNAKTSYRVTGREEAATRQTSFIGYFLRDGQVERYSASKTPTVCFRSLQCERRWFLSFIGEGEGGEEKEITVCSDRGKLNRLCCLSSLSRILLQCLFFCFVSLKRISSKVF